MSAGEEVARNKTAFRALSIVGGCPRIWYSKSSQGGAAIAVSGPIPEESARKDKKRNNEFNRNGS